MIIGIDFDNTIVCYDAVFHEAAVARGLVSSATPATKTAVRDALRRAGREDAWTELQGWVYGCYIEQATPFPGVADFFHACSRAGVEIQIISHKTQRPFAGPDADLHVAARDWLRRHHLLDASHESPGRRVFFEATKQDKLTRIANVPCDWFIDDLPEFLAEPGFPQAVRTLLFDPHDMHHTAESLQRATSWQQITDLILGSNTIENGR